jgi:hypothetical protein
MLTPADLLTIRLVHNAMRVEYGRLAVVARAPRDAAHAALIENQIVLTLGGLHHHHSAEDKHFWPTLRARAPHAAAALDQLEAQHTEIAPVLAAAADTARPLADRAETLATLQSLVAAHLDEEEAVAFPLLLAHLTPDESAEIGKDVDRGMNRRDIPVLYGWYASAGDAETRAAVLATVPLVPRILFKLFWAPAYQRRFSRLYGSTAAVSDAHASAGAGI